MTTSVVPQRVVGSDYMPVHLDVIVEHEFGKQIDHVHWHDFHKLVYVAGGSGTHLLNGAPLPIERGAAFLLTPSDFHAWRPDGTGCELYNVLFAPRVLSDYLKSSLFGAGRFGQGALVARGMHDLPPLLDRMVRESGHDRPDARLALESLLQCVLVEFMRYTDVGESLGARAGTSIHEGVRQALAYMEQHYRDPLSLELVAAKAHLSPNYFSQLFHEIVGVTFQEHLQILRVGFARSLLRSTDMSVTDICYSSGFHTLSHFQRTFKGRYGTSPSACRRDVRIPRG